MSRILDGDEMTNDEVYAKEVFPLMVQIINICKRYKIAVLANFLLSANGQPDLRCTTALLVYDFEPSKELTAALSLLRDSMVAFAVQRGLSEKR